MEGWKRLIFSYTLLNKHCSRRVNITRKSAMLCVCVCVCLCVCGCWGWGWIYSFSRSRLVIHLKQRFTRNPEFPPLALVEMQLNASKSKANTANHCISDPALYPYTALLTCWVLDKEMCLTVWKSNRRACTRTHAHTDHEELLNSFLNWCAILNIKQNSTLRCEWETFSRKHKSPVLEDQLGLTACLMTWVLSLEPGHWGGVLLCSLAAEVRNWGRNLQALHKSSIVWINNVQVETETTEGTWL